MTDELRAVLGHVVDLRAKIERLTALLKEARSHVRDAGATGLVDDIDRVLEHKP